MKKKGQKHVAIGKMNTTQRIRGTKAAIYWFLKQLDSDERGAWIEKGFKESDAQTQPLFTLKPLNKGKLSKGAASEVAAVRGTRSVIERWQSEDFKPVHRGRIVQLAYEQYTNQKSRQTLETPLFNLPIKREERQNVTPF